jgi:hypothetical protein
MTLIDSIPPQDVTRRALDQTLNELLRDDILKTCKVIYANNQAVYAEG